MKKERQRN